MLTAKDNQDNGCIINTCVRVAGDPTRLMISCQMGNLTREIIEKTGKFNISVLTEDVPFETIRHFGMQSGRDVDKIQSLGLTLEEPVSISVPGICQLPLTLECKVLMQQKQDLAQLPEEILKKYYPQGVDGSAPGKNRDFHIAYYGEIVNAYLIED